MSIPGSHQISMWGYRIFVPHPLPPPLTITPDLYRIIEEAAHLLGQVEMCRTLLPNPELFIYASLQREALASSTIEGTITTPEQLMLFQASHRAEDRNAHEVANYATALRWGIAQLPVLPISTRVILGLHERLMEGVRGQIGAGRYKQYQNHLGPAPGTPIDQATFVPPSPEMTPDLMAQLERYINAPTHAEPRVVQCALAHYQFETIHPFPDGNGRVGRLLIILHLMQLGLLTAPLIHPSVFFERTRAEYYGHLQAVRTDGAWEAWIRYFVEGLAQQCRETLHFTRVMLALIEELRQSRDIRRQASTHAVLEAFFTSPMLSTVELRARTGLSPTSVNTVLDYLAQHEIVREITGKARNRVYICLPLIRAIFYPENRQV